MLTERAVLAAAPRAKPYKVPDSGGLYLHVSSAGTRSWRYKYRTCGKEKSARLARDAAKQSLAAGRDPAVERRRVELVGEGRAEETFEK